jgi:hypothetical protein
MKINFIDFESMSALNQALPLEGEIITIESIGATIRVWLKYEEQRSQKMSEGIQTVGSYGEYAGVKDGDRYKAFGSTKQAYANIWDSIYGNWKENPWVWVIDFKNVKTSEGE